MSTNVEIRRASVDDAAQVAALKLLWAPPPGTPTAAEREEFARHLGMWFGADTDSRICMVAELDGALVGMAWLVIFERAPDFGARRRLTGDVQSVFVLPEHRRAGLGGRLVDALVAVADERGVHRVTVSSNTGAAPVYRRAGFVDAPLLLERRSTPPT